MINRKNPARSSKTSARLHRASAFALEGLEIRQHLSVSHPLLAQRPIRLAHTITPSFIRFRPVGAVQPFASTSPTGLSPATVRHAYGIDQLMFGSIVGDGAGQTIAIVDAYDAPNIAADLHTFDLTFGLADPPSFTKVGQTGSTTSLPGTDPSGRGNSWAVETSLDIEWAHAVAPKANILLVEANSASDANLFAAIDTARRWTGVSTVSMSWGGGEYSGQSTYDRYFTTPSGHNGVTFIASSGDSGAYDYYYTSTRAVEYPASSPNVLSIGGTRLSTDSSGNYLSESGWGSGTSSGSSGGSGGGISSVVSQPAYQRGIVTQSTTARAVPDVAFDADPASGVSVIDSWDSPTAPWMRVGGTSLAAPMWAGVIALANQGRVLSGQSTLDGATQTLPKIYALPSSDFHDITTGNNGYAAGVGYDLVTGRGTPIVNRLVPDLVGSTVVIPTPTIAAMTVSPTSVTTGATVTLTATGVQETGGSISNLTFYRESNGISGLQVGSDTTLGAGAASGTTYTLSTSTAGLSAGSYTYYAVATDAKSHASTPASATLTVTAPAPANNNFASAITISGTAATVTGSSVNANKELGEPLHAGFAGGRSVWWSWTAPSNLKVNLSTFGSSYDTLLGVYTGATVSTLTTIAGNDDDPAGGRTSALSFNAVAGTTYKIAVDGYGGASGSIVLALSTSAAPVAPVNDNFANAINLVGPTLNWTGSNVNATKEAGEPNHAGRTSAGASIWFTWTATATKTVSINTHGSNFDTILAVYTGTALTGLTAVASNDDDSANGTLTSAVSFNAVAGTTYRIAVAGYAARTGAISLSIA